MLRRGPCPDRVRRDQRHTEAGRHIGTVRHTEVRLVAGAGFGNSCLGCRGRNFAGADCPGRRWVAAVRRIRAAAGEGRCSHRPAGTENVTAGGSRRRRGVAGPSGSVSFTGLDVASCQLESRLVEGLTCA